MTHKLVDGLIPMGTECPYRKACGSYAETSCIHLGTKHNIDFSCGFARAFEIIAERKDRSTELK